MGYITDYININIINLIEIKNNFCNQILMTTITIILLDTFYDLVSHVY